MRFESQAMRRLDRTLHDALDVRDVVEERETIEVERELIRRIDEATNVTHAANVKPPTFKVTDASHGTS